MISSTDDANAYRLVEVAFASKEILAKLLIHCHHNICVHLRDGTILAANDTFAYTTGYSHNELLEIGYQGLISKNYYNHVLKIVIGNRFTACGVSDPYEYPLIAKNRGVIFLRAQTFAADDMDFMISIQEDITGLKLLEKDMLDEHLLNHAKPSTPKLSVRERQISRLIAHGMTSPEIADQLCISIKTVGNHRNSIRRKLQISKFDGNLGDVLQCSNMDFKIN